MKNDTPDAVLETIRETARNKGCTYLMSYEIQGPGVIDILREGYISVDPRLSLKEALDCAALSDDLKGRSLIVREIFNLETNKPEEGFPTVITGLPVTKPERGMN